MTNENRDRKLNIPRLSNNISTINNNSQSIRLSNDTRLGIQSTNENGQIQRLNLESVRKSLGNETIIFTKNNKKSSNK